jgi:hypothetical protein
MVRKVIVTVSLISGVVLLLLGATWKYWHSPKSVWTKEEAHEYSEAARLLKLSATSRRVRGDVETDPKLAAAQARYDAIQAKLDRAIAFHDYAGVGMAALGAAITAVATWLLWLRSKSAANPN